MKQETEKRSWILRLMDPETTSEIVMAAALQLALVLGVSTVFCIVFFQWYLGLFTNPELILGPIVVHNITA